MDEGLANGLIIMALVVIAAVSDTPRSGWRGAMGTAAFAVIVAVCLTRIWALARGWWHGQR